MNLIEETYVLTDEKPIVKYLSKATIKIAAYPVLKYKQRNTFRVKNNFRNLFKWPNKVYSLYIVFKRDNVIQSHPDV